MANRLPLTFKTALRAVHRGDLSSTMSQPDPEHDTREQASQILPAHYFTPSLTLFFFKPSSYFRDRTSP